VLAPVSSASATAGQPPLLGLALAIGVEIAILHWAAPSITSSLLGSAMLEATNSLFAGELSRGAEYRQVFGATEHLNRARERWLFQSYFLMVFLLVSRLGRIKLLS